MKSRQISFSPPDITEAEIEEVAEALRSGLPEACGLREGLRSELR